MGCQRDPRNLNPPKSQVPGLASFFGEDHLGGTRNRWDCFGPLRKLEVQVAFSWFGFGFEPVNGEPGAPPATKPNQEATRVNGPVSLFPWKTFLSGTPVGGLFRGRRSWSASCTGLVPEMSCVLAAELGFSSREGFGACLAHFVKGCLDLNCLPTNGFSVLNH